ncbi:MAG: serine/threonine protein kinase [Ectothiorhodospiraceae bacterium]|nr:serine/threonine protein kinase [Ectothiorhodospiraceae bacterium]MCH8506244.1 serine/threonine protein kinase [Ectothiorhodospiraceae bacterium]
MQWPAPGSVLGGRYLLLRHHASGGTSVIYRGRDLLAERAGYPADVAIKIIRGIDDPELALRMSMLELATSRRLPEAGLIRVHDCGRQGATPYLIMEWLEGENLAELLHRSPDRRLPLRRAATILTPVANTLFALHRRGMVHTDVKPGNIFLTTDGRVKLLDLATVREMGDGQEQRGETGWLGYSPAYASPETRNDEPASPQDDIYSLACVLYETIAGTKPYPSTAEKGDAPPAPRRPGTLNPAQWELLRRSLASDHEKRPRSAPALLQGMRLAATPMLAGWAASVVLAIAVLVAALAPHENLVEEEGGTVEAPATSEYRYTADRRQPGNE